MLYEYLFSTGCGSSSAELSLDGAKVKISYSSRWMGQEPESYEYEGEYREITEYHGLIVIKLIQNKIKQTTTKTEVYFDCIKLPTSSKVIQGNEFCTMHQMGYCEWNQKFDLFLVMNDIEPEDEEIANTMIDSDGPPRETGILDKLKWEFVK